MQDSSDLTTSWSTPAHLAFNRSEGSFRPIYKNSYLQGEEILIGLQSDDSIRQSRLDLNPLLIVYDKDNKEVFRDYMTANEAEYRLGLELDKPGDYRFEISDKASGERAGGLLQPRRRQHRSPDLITIYPCSPGSPPKSGGRIVDSAYKPIPAEPEIHIQLHKSRFIASVSDQPLYSALLCGTLPASQMGTLVRDKGLCPDLPHDSRSLLFCDLNKYLCKLSPMIPFYRICSESKHMGCVILTHSPSERQDVPPNTTTPSSILLLVKPPLLNSKQTNTHCTGDPLVATRESLGITRGSPEHSSSRKAPKIPVILSIYNVPITLTSLVPKTSHLPVVSKKISGRILFIIEYG
jgi:hypothetical protein